NGGDAVSAAQSGGTTTPCRPSEPGAVVARCGARVAHLSGLQRSEAPNGISISVHRSANAPVDLPLLSAGIHEELVSPKPREADRGGLRATSSTSKASWRQDPRLPHQSPVRRLRGVR